MTTMPMPELYPEPGVVNALRILYYGPLPRSVKRRSQLWSHCDAQILRAWRAKVRFDGLSYRVRVELIRPDH